MRGSRIIDLLRHPEALQTGDIIGFDAFPDQTTARKAAANAGADLASFSTGTKPRYRALVLGTLFGGKKNDEIQGLMILPLAPVDRNTIRPKTDTSFVITHHAQKLTAGLNPEQNWQVNYVPTILPVNKKTMGTDENLQAVKFGGLPSALIKIVSDHMVSLVERRIVDVGLQGSRGQVRNYDHLQEGVGRGVSAADRRIAEQVAETEHGKVVQLRAERGEAAKAAAKEFKATPSGKIAYNLKLGFNKESNPDISLTNAQAVELLTEDQYLDLSFIAEKLNVNTLRTLYDSFVGDHEKTLDAIRATGANGPENEVMYKAKMENALKESLTEFYKILRANRTADDNRRPAVQAASTPYEGAPIGP